MITANELKIGNWIHVGVRCAWEPIEIVSGDQLSHLLNEHPEHNTYIINPIPLTPEILKMCGFVWDSEDNGDSLAEMYVLDKFVWSVGLKEMYYNNEPLPHIEYLHQLQNLVFALTGEELKINFHVEAAN